MGFEQLDVWRRSSKLCTEIYKHFQHVNDFGFKDQITRSALSIPSNIAEAVERGSIKENIQFLNYARGSCGELRTQIYIGLEIEYIPKELAKNWIQETKEISAMIVGLINSKKSSD